VRELDGEAPQGGALVLLAGAEPAGVGGAPVRHEHRALGVAVRVEERGEGGDHVPGTRGEVEHGHPRVPAQEFRIEFRHPGDRLPGGGVAHERVPRRDEGPGQVRHHHGVVDVRDEPDPRLFGDDPDARLHGLCREGVDRDGLPPRLQAVLADDDVDVAAQVGGGVDRRIAGRDPDGQPGDVGGHEESPPALRLGQRVVPGGVHLLRGRVLQDDPGEHAHELPRAVTGEGHDSRTPPLLPPPVHHALVDGCLDPCAARESHEPNLSSRCGSRQPPRAASTTSLAAAWTSARCSAPLKDSA